MLLVMWKRAFVANIVNESTFVSHHNLFVFDILLTSVTVCGICSQYIHISHYMYN